MAGRCSIHPQMDRSVTASLWGIILIWVVRAVSATDACTPSRSTWWPVSSVRTYGSMEALSTIWTMAGWGWNDVHRLERCVRRASWRVELGVGYVGWRGHRGAVPSEVYRVQYDGLLVGDG